MKKTGNYCLAIIAVVLLLGQFSCVDRVRQIRTFVANKPIYMSYENLRVAVSQNEAKPLIHPGKMYFYNNYVFVNEILDGIHIIDNSDPANPRNNRFIEIPGNIDIVIKDNYLYADSYVDLIVLDISDLDNVRLVKRIENVFPYQIPTYDMNYELAQIDENQGVVVGWTIEEVTEENIQSSSWGGGIYKDDASMEVMDNTSGGSSGVSGSTARFALYGNTLYMLNNSIMNVYDITDLENPKSKTSINTYRVSETLFVHNNMLFSGTQTGMVIYSLSNPENPIEIASLEHFQSCDPVVVDGDYAYVTLRAGNMCGGLENQLDVIDISTITDPILLKSYPLTEPYGLGIRNNTLFVCDGRAGLKVYNSSDPLQISDNLLQTFTDVHAYDVIPFDDKLMLIGVDGFYQYNFTQGEPLTLLSVIPVEND